MVLLRGAIVTCQSVLPLHQVRFCKGRRVKTHSGKSAKSVSENAHQDRHHDCQSNRRLSRLASLFLQINQAKDN